VKYYREPRQEFLVSEIYNKSAIFLSSSWTEGFALPPAEAGSCGCAIVSTNSGGIMDYVEDGETGLLSAPKLPEALGRNLCKVLDDDNLRQRLAENGRKRLSELSWAKSGSMMEALIGRD
jgi:glycosyltransferase involved in cell wall biosynthesis